MSLSLAFALLALAIVLIVSGVAYRIRGLGFALIAGGLTSVMMFAWFGVLVMFVTSRM